MVGGCKRVAGKRGSCPFLLDDTPTIDLKTSYSCEEVLILLAAARDGKPHNANKRVVQQGAWRTVKSRNTIKKERATTSLQNARGSKKREYSLVRKPTPGSLEECWICSKTGHFKDECHC